MIIGSAIKRVLDGFEIEVDNTSMSVKYEFGNQAALDLFIEIMDDTDNEKLPLIFYVVDKVDEFNDWKTCNTSLIILNASNINALSEERTKESYEKIIEPIYQKLRTAFTQNQFIQIIGETSKKMSYDDRPNYGIISGNVGAKSSKSSAISAYVDARIIDFKIRIKTNCII